MECRFRFSGEIDVVRTEEEADAAVLILKADAAVGKLSSARVVGFDMEWHAPRMKGVSPGKTSLVQVCSNANYCAVFSVIALGDIPASLWAFIATRQSER